MNTPPEVQNEPIRPHEHPAQRSPINRAWEIPAPEGTAPPVPDEYALAAYDAPSEGRERRQAQDDAAEGSQDVGEVFD